MKNLIFLFHILLLGSCGEESNSGLIDGIEDGDHRIFVTSSTYNGNLDGISGANDTCQSHAQDAGLVRDYEAIISDSSGDANSNLNISGAVYNFSNGSSKKLIVSSASELWDTDTTDLLDVIEYDENYSFVSSTPWTGTDSDGSAAISGDYCNDWSTSSSSVDGQVGDNSSTDDAWLEDPTSISCNSSRPLYCISI